MATKPRKAKKGEILSDQISETYVHYDVLSRKIKTLINLVIINIFSVAILAGLIIGLNL